jgi:hypothetical protein
MESVITVACDVFIRAIKMGNIVAATSILENNSLILKEARSRNYDVLELAAASRHLLIVKLLLKENFIQDEITSHKTAALQTAASKGYLEIVDELLQYPAVKKSAGLYGSPALINAGENGHLKVVERLLHEPTVRETLVGSKIEFFGKNYILEAIAKSGQVSVVKRLLQEPEVLRDIAAEDHSALRISAHEGHRLVAYQLIQGYRSLDVSLPIDVEIGNYQNLNLFFEEYSKKLDEIESLMSTYGLVQEMKVLIFSYSELPLEKRTGQSITQNFRNQKREGSLNCVTPL